MFMFTSYSSFWLLRHWTLTPSPRYGPLNTLDTAHTRSVIITEYQILRFVYVDLCSDLCSVSQILFKFGFSHTTAIWSNVTVSPRATVHLRLIRRTNVAETAGRTRTMSLMHIEASLHLLLPSSLMLSAICPRLCPGLPPARICPPSRIVAISVRRNILM
jgi:hypothetical protein